MTQPKDSRPSCPGCGKVHEAAPLPPGAKLIYRIPCGTLVARYTVKAPPSWFARAEDYQI